MTSNHLTDQEIQEYVSALIQHEPHVELVHIQTCEVCKMQVNNYLQMMSAIGQLEKPAFAFDVSALVLPQLPVQRKGSVIMMLLAYADVVVAIMTVSGFLYFFRKVLSPIFSGHLSINLVLITTALMTMVFLIIDMNRNYHKKMMQLDNM